MKPERWPIIRHIRYFIVRRRLNEHYALWESLGYLPTYYHWEEECLDAIWRGEF